MKAKNNTITIRGFDYNFQTIKAVALEEQGIALTALSQ
jgi:hypothetical protein